MNDDRKPEKKQMSLREIIVHLGDARDAIDAILNKQSVNPTADLERVEVAQRELEQAYYGLRRHLQGPKR